MLHGWKWVIKGEGSDAVSWLVSPQLAELLCKPGSPWQRGASIEGTHTLDSVPNPMEDLAFLIETLQTIPHWKVETLANIRGYHVEMYWGATAMSNDTFKNVYQATEPGLQSAIVHAIERMLDGEGMFTVDGRPDVPRT